MKVSVFLSAFIHFAIMAWAMFAISGPAPLVTLQDRGVQVDFAVESPSESGRGEREAAVDPKPSPLPSERPQKIREAENLGEANEDSKSREGVVNEKTLDTVQASAAPEAERNVTATDVKPDPVIDASKEETPVPTNEVASLSEPKAPVVEEPDKEEDLPLIDPAAQSKTEAAIPVPVPAPQNRPKPKTAQTRERKQVEEVKRKETAASTETGERVTDRVAQLLNSQKDTAGGAKRQPKEASIGADEAKQAPQLTRGELDALKGRVSECWRIPVFVDGENLRVVVEMRMSRDGQLSDITRISVTGLTNPSHVRAVEGGLRRNLSGSNCQFSDVLPKDKYATWKDVRINFEPQDF